jgi:hypothetical protein
MVKAVLKSKRVPLEFLTGQALVDAAAAEDDTGDDCRELEAMHRAQRALALCAYLVVRDGPVVIPLFEKLERELAAMRQTQDTVARARALLETYSGMTEHRAIEPPVA